jgi:hypothetical protein
MEPRDEKMLDRIPDERTMAFWDYDIYPYVLCGEVSCFPARRSHEMHYYSLVKIKEYGHSTFKPFLLLPLEEGIALKQQLETLKNDFRIEQTRLRAKFSTKLNAIEHLTNRRNGKESP